MEQPEIIVVGGGILGAFHAYFAACRGFRVRILEQKPFPADASVRNFGMLPQTIVPAEGPWAEIARDSAAIYREIQAEHDITVAMHGSLYLASTSLEDAVLREFTRMSDAHYRCEYLSADEVHYRFPLVRESYCAGALLFPTDMSLDPARMLRRFIPYLEGAFGVRYCPRMTAIHVRRNGAGCIIDTSTGERLTAERVIICSGAECQLLFPHILSESGLEVCKLQMMRTVSQPTTPDGQQPNGSLPSILSGLSIRRYPAFAHCPSHPALLDEAIEQPLAEADIHVLLKQSSDGSYIIGDSHQYGAVGDRSAFDERTDPAINRTIATYAQRMLALADWRIAELWNGYYLRHPDKPLFTAAIDENIHLVTGIGGKGMTTSPGVARRSIAEIFDPQGADSATY